MFGALWMAASPAGAADDAPATVPLIKLEYPGNPPNIRMLYIRLLALGDRRVDQPLLFDTGSAGMTVECSVVLPANLCSESGIAIKKTLELDGITVTTEKAVLNYGTYDEYGNIAMARVTIGAREQPIATAAAIPLLVRYKKVRRATGEVVGGPLWPKGTFGVSPVGGAGPERTLTSPLMAIRPENGLRRGYYLSPIGTDWKICTNEEGNCPEVAALHIGISESVRSGFKTSKWQRADAHYNFPTIDACIAWGDESVCRPTLYDTGNSTIMVAGKPRKKTETSLGVGVDVAVTAPNHDAWKFKTTYQPEVELVPQLPYQIVGIRYFEANSLLFDLDAAEIGFRIGN
ncbi:MAG TPA: hypothetical protein VMM15_13300 [Bradyrhizobium sp.]|nr:hypothetical protein [Bradyrhizobium sp.]